MGLTTSRPQRRSKGNPGSNAKQGRSGKKSRPLRSIHLEVTLVGPETGEAARIASEKGLAVAPGAGPGRLSLVLSAATPEEALAQIALLGGLLARRT